MHARAEPVLRARSGTRAGAASTRTASTARSRASARPTTAAHAHAATGPRPPAATIAGRKMSTGTAGCTRESASSTRDSNIGGEARSTSVRWPSVAHVLCPAHQSDLITPKRSSEACGARQPGAGRRYAGSPTATSAGALGLLGGRSASAARPRLGRRRPPARRWPPARRRRGSLRRGGGAARRRACRARRARPA